MITPDYLNEIIQGTQLLVDRVNTYLLERVANRISKTFEDGNGDLFIPSTKNDLKLLQNGGMLADEIQQELEKRLPDIKKEVKQAFKDSADEMIKHNNDIAKAIVEANDIYTTVPNNAKLTPREIRNLENAYKRTNHSITNMTRTTAGIVNSDYIEACDKAYNKAQRGIPIGQAIEEAIEEVSQKGIRVVNYGNKVERIEVAIARAVRTGINQANAEITLQRIAEMGGKYVKVSEHLGARVTNKDDYTNHSWWQGKVYSLDWNSDILKDYKPTIKEEKGIFGFLKKIRDFLLKEKEKYPDFVTTCGYGNIEGIIGINCRHTFSIFYPDINIDRGQTIDPGENKKRYALEQQQRARERRIRKLKQLARMYQSAGMKDKFLNLMQKATLETHIYMDFCHKNGLKPRNYALKVA